MIYYLSIARCISTMSSFLDSWGKDVADVVELVPYEEIFKKFPKKSGVYIFGDLERLTYRELERLAQYWGELESADDIEVTLLNHPTRVMRRYELLRNLHQKGINEFNVYKLTEAREPSRYPVYIRDENAHLGKVTPLLNNVEELRLAVADLKTKNLCREELIITEFVDTVDTTGLYRKYSSFCINGQIIPRHIFFSKDWFIKTCELVADEYVKEEWEFVNSKNYSDQVGEIFKMAAIDYGRMDFSFSKAVDKNGNRRIQVWEINTNPMIVRLDDIGIRNPTNLAFVQTYNKCLLKLNQKHEPTLFKKINNKLSLAKQSLFRD
jgi:hypothetical protein